MVERREWHGSTQAMPTLMESDTFLVRFWGVRGSFPVPGPRTVRYGGNTPCVEVRIGQHTLILDAGTGIIGLGHDLVRRSCERQGAPIVATLLLTHTHHDHTQGFPFFAPANIGSSVLHILGPYTLERKLEDALSSVVITPDFPLNLNEMPSLKTIHSLRENESLLFGNNPVHLRIYNIHRDEMHRTPDMIHVSILKSYAHPKTGVYIYRIEWRNKSVVFATDTEGYHGTDQRLVRFARDTDLLIHDAQYTDEQYVQKRQGWGHSTPSMACAVAKQCGARQLALFHHDPDHDDALLDSIERTAQKCFPTAFVAHEGQEIHL